MLQRTTKWDFMDSEGMYLGVVKFKNKWRIFYDDKLQWVLDFSHSDLPIPDRRQNLIRVDNQNTSQFFALFQTEFSTVQLSKIVGKIALTVLIDLDNRLLVERSTDDGFSISSKLYVPDNWDIRHDNPHFYTPTWLRQLWITKHRLNSDEGQSFVTIPKYCQIGAVKFEGNWQVYFEEPSAWILDLQNYMLRFQKGDYFTNPIYSNWRRNLPFVTSERVADYLLMFDTNKLTDSEINELIYAPTASEFEWNPSNIFRKPQLDFVINFDEKLYVSRAYSQSQMELDISTSDFFVPKGWVCHRDNPHNFVPEVMGQNWNNI